MTGGGPLDGIKVVHLASLGPGPYGVMLLADLGADVVVVDRASGLVGSMPPEVDPRRRGQTSIGVDLKHPDGRQVLIDLVRSADVLVEGMRPGVAERLGLGPTDLAEVNDQLVYARMTGWGQQGPYALKAGHDINYIAATGALHAMGAPGSVPPVPLNLLGDYAGGGTFLAIGVVAALLERSRTGRGSIVDAAIVDGVASLSTAMVGMAAAGLWTGRGQNAFDGSRPWYRCYATRDGKYVAVGAVEPVFYDTLLETLGLDREQWRRDDGLDVPALAASLAEIFASEDRDHWAAVFADVDACVSPVLDLDEAQSDAAALERRAYVDVGGVAQPAPAPRFSDYEPALSPPPAAGRDTVSVLLGIGRDEAQVEKLLASGAVVLRGDDA